MATSQRVLHVAVLEPYYGGSHAAFVDSLRQRSRHRITVATLPARKWKWRMRGAAMWFAREETQWQRTGGGQRTGGAVDLLLCNDMMSVADLKALLPPCFADTPIICYFHENQLTYPLPPDQFRDFQYGMTNITSALAADVVWFNSQFHRTAFLEAAAALLEKMPDFRPTGVLAEIENKSTIMPPPVEIEPVEKKPRSDNAPPTILWCHRWEYDKNPEPFFRAIVELIDRGFNFELVLLGEQFRTAPAVFASAWPMIVPRIRHCGYLPQRRDYLAMLRTCDVVVSTAIQENFGMGVVEAILSGCQPLVPNRLAYPEVIPSEFHAPCLYTGDEAILDRLRGWLEGEAHLEADAQRRLQALLAERCGASGAVARIDAALSYEANQR